MGDEHDSTAMSANSLRLFNASFITTGSSPGVGSSAIMTFAPLTIAVAKRTRLAIPPDS